MSGVRYTATGDALVEADGSWLCEHELGDGPAPSARLIDPGTTPGVIDAALTRCPDCGTVWACWTFQGERRAKRVVMAS